MSDAAIPVISLSKASVIPVILIIPNCDFHNLKTETIKILSRHLDCPFHTLFPIETAMQTAISGNSSQHAFLVELSQSIEVALNTGPGK